MSSARLLPLLFLAVLPSCATIIRGPTDTVSFACTPAARLVINDHLGNPVYDGPTPADVPLKTSAGYFVGASYSVRMEADGYLPVQLELDAWLSPWYFGNLVFGGLLGFLVVDPLTGSMWKIHPSGVSITLEPVAPSTRI